MGHMADFRYRLGVCAINCAKELRGILDNHSHFVAQVPCVGAFDQLREMGGGGHTAEAFVPDHNGLRPEFPE